MAIIIIKPTTVSPPFIEIGGSVIIDALADSDSAGLVEYRLELDTIQITTDNPYNITSATSGDFGEYEYFASDDGWSTETSLGVDSLAEDTGGTGVPYGLDLNLTLSL